MVSRFTEVCVDCENPRLVADFWASVLGWTVHQDDGDEEFVYIQEGPGLVPAVAFIRVPEKKTVKNRLHIDVNATDGTRDEEVARLETLGATRVDIGQGDVSWVVMADPE